MSYSRIRGQEHALRILRGAIASKRPGHAYLFHGNEGTGKSTVALEFARALNCERGEPEACDECLSCRRALHGTLIDIEVIEPGSKTGQSIEIDQIREMIARANTRPVEGCRKVFLLPQAEKLSPPAMQTLLKTLEEPPEYVTLVLETRNLTGILPTILSRCQAVRFEPLTTDDVSAVLRDRRAPEARIAVAAAYARGSVGEALRLATDTAAWKRRDRALDVLVEIARAKRTSLLRVAEDLQRVAAGPAASKGTDTPESGSSAGESERALPHVSSDRTETLVNHAAKRAMAPDDGDAASIAGDDGKRSETTSHLTEGEALFPARSGWIDLFRIVSSWYGDLLALSAGTDPDHLRNPDRLSVLNDVLTRYSTAGLLDAVDAIQRAEYALRRNANPRLLTESLAFELCPNHW